MDGERTPSNMAMGTADEVTKLKGTKIFVEVEEALIDVLVVSFHYGGKVFQGALLDVTKKSCLFGAFGQQSPSSTGGSVLTPTPGRIQETPEDKFHALKQRHTYFQHGNVAEVNPGQPQVTAKRQISRNVRDQSVRMRRLRPRQVLCSHCQAICNENNENIQKKDIGPLAKTRHNNSDNLSSGQDQKKQVTPQSTIGGLTSKRQNSPLVSNGEQTGNCRLSGIVEESRRYTQTKKYLRSGPYRRSSSPSKLGGEYQAVPPSELSGRMILRKRKFSGNEGGNCQVSGKILRDDIKGDIKGEIGSNNDDFNFGDKNNGAICMKSVLAKTSPVIKISFANPQGKDTIVKISPRLQSTNTSDTEEDGQWSTRENTDQIATKYASAKAAKKALKKAKKEAQKKSSVTSSVVSSITSPARTNVPLSTNVENGDTSVHKSRHHHHKHKLKRKKKHKEEGDENTDKEEKEFNLESSNFSGTFKLPDSTDFSAVLKNSENDSWSLLPPPSIDSFASNDLKSSDIYFDEVKSKCLKKKLSISLKRLNAKAYMRCSPKYVNEDSCLSEASSVSSAGSVGSSSGSEYGEVPDFPKHELIRDVDKMKPLTMRIRTHTVKKCFLENGREMTVGDIVWGKIHGFPWWPGKVLALIVSQRENGATLNQEAHVSWFGSSTSSNMPCNQLAPFLDDFKIRYNKKKRGPYKEAIRQATLEAQQGLHREFPTEVGIMS